MMGPRPDPYRAMPATALAFTQKDQNDLDTLAIIHFVYAAVIALLLITPFVFVLIGATVAVSSAESGHGDARAGIVAGGIFMVVAAVLGLLLVIKVGLTVWAGMCLRARRRMTLCYVVAAVECLGVPFGTALGIYTFVVLGRPQVKAAFT